MRGHAQTAALAPANQPVARSAARSRSSRRGPPSGAGRRGGPHAAGGSGRAAAFLKCEQLQPIGAFKIRGAYTAIRRLGPTAGPAASSLHSSGNHGQAVAFAAQRFGVRAVIVMPESAPAVKVAGVKRQGGEVVFAGRTRRPSSGPGRAVAAEEGLVMIPPFDHPDVIAGQATVGLEIVEQLPDVATVLVPVGGGGLLSGITRGLGPRKPAVEMVGVEPAGAPKLTAALAAGAPVALERTESIADGLLTLSVGRPPFRRDSAPCAPGDRRCPTARSTARAVHCSSTRACGSSPPAR